jgi:hypothetical protein
MVRRQMIRVWSHRFRQSHAHATAMAVGTKRWPTVTNLMPACSGR